MRPPIMLRMVDLPQPDGPTMATNSRSWTSKETGETAGTSRGPWVKGFARSRMDTRTRGCTGRGLLVVVLSLPYEGHVSRLHVRGWPLPSDSDPHLHCAFVGHHSA